MSNKKTRSERFTFLCNADERKLITAIAAQFRRSQADTIRFLIDMAAKELNIPQTNCQQDKPTDLLK